MRQSYFLFVMGLLCFVPAATRVRAQDLPGQAFFQPASSLAASRGGVVLPMIPAETGKPFSAMAISRSEQVYVDGTRVSHLVTMMEYRDMEGRTREEPAESPQPVKQIVIRDPVAGVRYMLNIAGKTATKTAFRSATALPIVQTPFAGPSGRGRGGRGGGAPFAPAEVQDYIGKLAQVQGAIQGLAQTAGKNQNETVEDLGMMPLNGVTAHGTRTTIVIPVGAIGNDREFRHVEERWFSDDLNLLIKSVATDPRFGTTTYERKNVSRQTPDPSLFQVPAGYSIVN